MVRGHFLLPLPLVCSPVHLEVSVSRWRKPGPARGGDVSRRGPGSPQLGGLPPVQAGSQPPLPGVGFCPETALLFQPQLTSLLPGDKEAWKGTASGCRGGLGRAFSRQGAGSSREVQAADPCPSAAQLQGLPEESCSPHLSVREEPRGLRGHCDVPLQETWPPSVPRESGPPAWLSLGSLPSPSHPPGLSVPREGKECGK